MPKEFILKYIDLISSRKMNTLHMHLTDDQAWRIQIKKYPRLTGVSSGGDFGGTVAASSDGEEHVDSQPHGGYFTQDMDAFSL